MNTLLPDRCTTVYANYLIRAVDAHPLPWRKAVRDGQTVLIARDEFVVVRFVDDTSSPDAAIAFVTNYVLDSRAEQSVPEECQARKVA